MSKDSIKVFLKILWSGLFGAFVGSWIADAASGGLKRIFPESDWNYWNIFLWGNHWFLRIIVSVVATFLGGFVVGLMVPDKTKLAGTISAIPTSLLFLLYFIFIIIYPPLSGSIIFGSYITIFIIIFISVPIARYGAGFGSEWRKSNSEYFGIPKRLIGMHWSVFIWIWFPYYILISDFSVTLYYMIYLMFDDLFHSEFRFVWLLGGTIIWFAALSQGYGLLKGLWFLVSGHNLGFNKSKTFGLVLVNILLLPLIGIGLRYLGAMLMNVDENLPQWLYFFYNFLSGNL